MQCEARSKRSQQQCRKQACVGRNTCSMHGGASPRGPASAAYKHGRYSAFLPTRLAEMYAASMHDPRLTDLRSEISLIDTRLSTLAERFNADEGPLSEGELQQTWTEIIMTVEARRRLVESMHRVDSENSISAEQALALIGVIAAELRSAVMRHAERSIANAILGDVSRAFAVLTGNLRKEPVLLNSPTE